MNRDSPPVGCSGKYECEHQASVERVDEGMVSGSANVTLNGFMSSMSLTWILFYRCTCVDKCIYI